MSPQILDFWGTLPPLVSPNLLVNVSFLGNFCTPLLPPLWRRLLWMVPKKITYARKSPRSTAGRPCRILYMFFFHLQFHFNLPGPSPGSLDLAQVALFPGQSPEVRAGIVRAAQAATFQPRRRPQPQGHQCRRR